MALIKTEVHTYQFQGEKTVSDAAQFLAQLPNGWILESLEWRYGSRSWWAKVRGPETVMD